MKGLSLIYHFQSSQNQNEDFRPARYKIVYFFNESGMVPPRLLQELLKSFPDSNSIDKSFLSLDELKDFALRVSQELGSEEVRLISVQDYNIAIDGAKDISSFQQSFYKFGEIFSSEPSSRKKGFFGKFFNS